MAWQIEFLATAKRELNKLDIRRQQAILDYLEDEIAGLENPRNRGKALVGDKQALWRYRVADYRIICEIRDAELIIVAVTIGHRKTCMSKLTKPDGVRSVAKQKLKNVY